MKIDPLEFLHALQEEGVGFFTGVPDSILAPFCAEVESKTAPGAHVVAANEGAAIGIAAGFHLATGLVPAVYLQNSGLGNALNPLASLAHGDVYGVPLLLIIGWRGEPNTTDEPQHMVQGRITIEQLALLGIPHSVLDGTDRLRSTIAKLAATSRATSAPVALLIQAGGFVARPPAASPTAGLSRESAIAELVGRARPSDLFVATTGKASRELFEIRRRRGEPPRDFLTVGSMGHASSIALGVALAQPERRVFCLDGDGAALMHLGSIATIGEIGPPNLVHVVLNNHAHDSVGGQRTTAPAFSFASVATSAGYRTALRIPEEAGFDEAWARVDRDGGPALWEVTVGVGSRNDLGRPTSTPLENKIAFMSHLND